MLSMSPLCSTCETSCRDILSRHSVETFAYRTVIAWIIIIGCIVPIDDKASKSNALNELASSSPGCIGVLIITSTIRHQINIQHFRKFNMWLFIFVLSGSLFLEIIKSVHMSGSVTRAACPGCCVPPIPQH